MGLGVHLSDTELRALLLRKAGSTPEQAAHFFLCGPCRKRALGAYPLQARAVLAALAPIEFVRHGRSHLEAPFAYTLTRVLDEIQREREQAYEIVERVAGGETVDVAGLGFQPLIFALAALKWSEAARQDDPRGICRVCRLTLALLQDPAYGETEIDAGVRRSSIALLWAELGNAYGLLGDFRESERALKRALALEGVIAEDPHAVACVLLLAAYYCKNVRDFEGATTLASRSLRALERLGEHRDSERARWLLAAIPFAQGDFHAAKQGFAELLSSPLTDRITELSAVFHLVKIHALDDTLFQAGRWLTRLRELAPQWSGCVGIQIKLKWLRGLIDGGTGDPASGARLLEKVRDYYLDQDIVIDAALASVDLASLWLKAGHKPEAARAASNASAVLTAAQPDNPALLTAIRTIEAATRGG